MGKSISRAGIEFRNCPICNLSSSNNRVFLEENIISNNINSSSYSSRKVPEFMCHRLIECSQCDLVYADSPPSQENLAHSYHAADYDSSEEAADAALSYIEALQSTFNRLTLGSALEIGTGTGVFLEYLVKSGFASVEGIEPSEKAIAAAPAHRLGWIKKGIFSESDYKPESFDLICCFMTMEHVRDPLLVTQAAMRLLKTGGAFVTITHDRRSWLNRCLGRLSPIIDIEHLQLFSSKSICYLLNVTGYKDISTRTFKNRYSTQYWLRLCPFPQSLKDLLLWAFVKTKLAQLKLSFNVGNSISIGFK